LEKGKSGRFSYHLFHAARANFLRRSGRLPQAREAYQQALNLCQNAAEQALLRKRIGEVGIMLQEE
jgi:RNA polymerase sigma-70 factor, ECF subfamily